MSRRETQNIGRKSQSKSNPVIWSLTFLAVAAVAVAAIWMLNRKPVTKNELPDTITISEAFAKREAGAFVLDVRQPEEWQEYHIPGSTLIPLGDLEKRINELPRDQEIVVVCRSGNRSQPGRDTLLEAGFTKVTSMDGGLKEWAASGYPTVPGD